jgi:hypothetical protein
MSSNLNYLKPLNINDILAKPSDTDTLSYSLNKAVALRNAYSGAKLALLNFVKDCVNIETKLQNDISDCELEGLKLEYITHIQLMITTIVASLNQSVDGKPIINFEYPKYSDSKPNIKNLYSARSSELTFVHPSNMGTTNKTLISYIPGIILYQIPDFGLQIKFSEPVSVSGLLCDKRNNDKDTCYDIISPITYKYPHSNTVVNAFNDTDICRDFVGDILNNNNNLSINNQIADVIAFFDKLIVSIENSHRTIVQLSKIHNYN